MNRKVRYLLFLTASTLLLISLFTIAFHWYFNPARLPEDSDLKIRAQQWAEISKDPLSEKAAKQGVETMVAKLEDDNAARYYLMASLEKKGFHEFDEMWSRLHGLVYSRWQEDDRELEGLIKDNESVFQLIKTGTGQRRCSWRFSQQRNSPGTSTAADAVRRRRCRPRRRLGSV